MSEMMTMTEIEKRFDKEWVLIGDPVCAKDLRVKKGKVLAHHKDRDVLYKKAIRMKPSKSAVLYIGDRPRELVYVL